MNMKQRIQAAMDFTEEVIANPDAFPEKMVVIPYDPELLSSIFTPERLKIWRLVHKREADSITQLAKKLGRDVSRVRQDLLILERVNLVGMERNSSRVRVWPTATHIVIAAPS